MTDTTAKRLSYFENWPHPVAGDILAAFDLVQVTRLRFAMDEPEIWSGLARAHIYQVRSARHELPEPFHVSDRFLERCPELLAVSTWGAGYDTVDVDACTAAGVIAVNQAGGNSEGVAEHALGMMLALSKRMIEADRALRRGPEVRREDLKGNDIRHKTLGVIGIGHVGSRLAQLAGTLFDMRVLACDPYLSGTEIRARGAEPVSMEELLGQSDFVSVHCPRTGETTGMLGVDAFARMRPGAFIVNTARGGIHDEAALFDALSSGHLGGAGLDVWDQEPPPPDHPLLSLDTVIATPHTAGVTHESRRNVCTIAAEQVLEICAGRRPPRLLNPDAWPRFAERFNGTVQAA